MNKGKILVIDNSLIVRKLAEAALIEEGYEVVTSSNSSEGLLIAQKIQPSLILIGLAMTDTDCYQFCLAIRKNNILKTTPIMLITDKGENVLNIFNNEFDSIYYFIKPFKSEELIEKINFILLSINTQKQQYLIQQEKSTKGSQINNNITIEDPCVKMIEKYLDTKLPFLVQKNIENILKTFGLIKDANIIFSGNIEFLKTNNILQLIDNNKLNGCLFVYSDTTIAEIYFEGGRIIFATTSKQAGTSNILKINDISIIKEYIFYAISIILKITNGRFFFEDKQIPEALTNLKTRLSIAEILNKWN